MPTTHHRRPGRPAKPIERSKLLSLARKVFSDHGYTAASLSQIAGLAGLRKASLYHHFPTKESLYHEVLESEVRALRAIVVGAHADVTDFVEGLDAMGDRLIDHFARDPQSARLLLREMVGIDNYAEGPGKKEVQATLDAIASFLKAGMKAGVFRAQEAKQLTMTIVGLHLYFFSATGLAGDFLGAEVFAPATVRKRKAAVKEQVRALCLTARALAKLG